MEEKYIGKKVLARSSEAGIYFGTLEAREGGEVRMSGVRNIWHWTGATCLSEIANSGVTGDRIGPKVAEMEIMGVCQIIPLSDRAITNLESQPEWTAR